MTRSKACDFLYLSNLTFLTKNAEGGTLFVKISKNDTQKSCLPNLKPLKNALFFPHFSLFFNEKFHFD